MKRDPKTLYLHIRISAEEKKKLEALASAENMTLSNYVRWRLLRDSKSKG